MSNFIKIAVATVLTGTLLSSCYWMPNSYSPEYQNQYGNEPETSIHKEKTTANTYP